MSGPETRLGPVARVLDGAIAVYQRLFAGRPSPCRYVPSCSTYGREALAHHGALRGSWLTARRLLRCAPWGSWGYDPVPGTTSPSSSSARAASTPDPTVTRTP